MTAYRHIKNWQHVVTADLAVREHITNNSPAPVENGSGFVVGNVDMVLRWYGKKYHTDAQGKYALLELKHGSDIDLAAGQRIMFQHLDAALKADPRYKGFWRLNYRQINDKIYYQQLTRLFTARPTVIIGHEHITRRLSDGNL